MLKAVPISGEHSFEIYLIANIYICSTLLTVNERDRDKS